MIRATRNCPWNRCRFCPVYRGTRFELRSVADILNDIEAARVISDGIREMAWTMGHGDKVREVAAQLYNQPAYGQCVSNVALWLLTGGRSAFLQDSNTLIMRTHELAQVLVALREAFPGLHRVTTYGRSHTARRKSLSDLKELKEAGLDRVHIGLETGYDPLLTYMEKGCTAQDHIEGGRRVKEAGISLCEYVMPGLGGKKMSQQHARETASVLNQIDPDYIRLRSLHVSPTMALWEGMKGGDFQLQTEDEVVEEIGVLIENLEVNSYLKSDHTLNLLMEVKGKLPDDREKCLDTVHRYLSLPDEERLNFQFGRRAGYYSSLADLADSYKYGVVAQAMERLGVEAANAEDALFQLKNSFI